MKNRLIVGLGMLLFLLSLFELQAQKDSTSLQLKILSGEDMILPPPLEKLEIVTATRSGSRGLEDFPVTVYVVPKEEIRLNGYTTLVDVLKSVPGIKISKPGGALEGESFFMRGLLGNQYTKVLIDGLPMQPSVKGSIGIAENLPIAQAEKIEVIYGPAATIYGSDAMAGVINIITQKVDHGLIAQGSMVGGRDGYRHVNFMAGGKIGRNKNVLAYTVYANMSKRDNMNVYHDNYLFDPSNYAFYNGPFNADGAATLEEIEAAKEFYGDYFVSGDLYRDSGWDYYKGTGFSPEKAPLPQTSYLLGMTATYRNFQFSYNETYRRDHSSLGRNPLYFSYAQSKYFIGEKSQRIALTYNNRWDELSFTFNSSYLHYRLDEESSYGNNYYTGFGGQSYYYQASDDAFLEALLNYSPNNNWDLLMGVSHQWSGNLPATNSLELPFEPQDYQPFSTELVVEPQPVYGFFGYNPVTFSTSSVFLQGFYHRSKWSFLSGIRFLRASSYDTPSSEAESALLLGNLATTFIPRIGLLYKLSEVSSLRLSLAGGYRLPPTNQLYSSLALPGTRRDGTPVPNTVNYQQVPSVGLSPELSSSMELGYRYLFSTKVYADATFYINTVTNRLNNAFVELSTSQYPKATFNYINSNGEELILARQWVNSGISHSSLLGLQLMLRARDIIPRYKLGADFFFKMAGGIEQLPSGYRLYGYREVPNRFLQMNFSLSPFKNAYLRIENVWSSSWIRRNIQGEAGFKYPYARVDGYFVTDLLARYDVSKNLSLYIKVLNISNTKYGGIGAEGLDVDLYYLPQLERNIQFGVSFSK